MKEAPRFDSPVEAGCRVIVRLHLGRVERPTSRLAGVHCPTSGRMRRTRCAGDSGFRENNSLIWPF